MVPNISWAYQSVYKDLFSLIFILLTLEFNILLRMKWIFSNFIFCVYTPVKLIVGEVNGF